MPTPDLHTTDPRALLRQLFDVAVARAQPAVVLAAHLPPLPRGRTVVVGAGKAAGAMAHALEAAWLADAPLTGCVVTRYDHTPPRPAGVTPRIDIIEAAHPVPDEASVAAGERMLALVQGLTVDDLVIALISGGGSACLTLPIDGVSLADKQRINRELLASGAPIDAMNTVRKHLSRIKGGQLAAAAHPARVLTLAISDVPGDDAGVIASGPTVPDTSTCADALAVAEQYKLSIPPAMLARWRAGQGETPKPGDARLAQATVHIIATPMQSLQAAADAASAAGMAVHILGDDLEGESQGLGRSQAALALRVQRGEMPDMAAPCLLLSGGETTVTLPSGQKPTGRGGRAGEFALGLADGLNGAPGIWGLAADTDGIDGIEANAGAIVTPDTLARAAAQGLDFADAKARHDSHTFFGALGDLVVTGPTHTNVNDFRAIWVDRVAAAY